MVVLLGYEFEEYDKLSGRIAANAVKSAPCFYELDLHLNNQKVNKSSVQVTMTLAQYCNKPHTIEIKAWYSSSNGGVFHPFEDGNFQVDLVDYDIITRIFTHNVSTSTTGNIYSVGINVIHPITGISLTKKSIIVNAEN